MELLVIILSILTFVFTLVGGLVTLKFKKSLPYFFAFAAGALIAVAFLDLLPEALNLAGQINFPVRYIMITIVISFFLYSLIDKYFVTHCIGQDCDIHGHIMGPIGAGSLILHSFFDGVAIGSAFLINSTVGLTVALAVIFHDFTDGINTVTIMLKNKQETKKTVFFLFMDALAPILGVLILNIINVPEKFLIIILGVFIGEFIYLGAANLLPEIKEHHSKKVLITMALGILLIGILTSII
ncbi:MAG: ZIP family metal transporter [Parcubacteria group bacterium]|jgi:ZIP family zinc transporter